METHPNLPPPPNSVALATNLICRRLKTADIPSIMAIESVSFGRFHWSAQAFEQEMSNHLARYWVLTHQPDGYVAPLLAGYIGYWLVFDEVHITTVAISPDHRGMGLGELLVAKALELGQGHSARMVTLEVRRSNTVAQNLYTKYGFVILGTRPQYYQDNNEDALIMTNADILAPAFRANFKQRKAQLFERLKGSPIGF
jgi:[ribosomal protein S18]-alanine N-acetyltransferase